MTTRWRNYQSMALGLGAVIDQQLHHLCFIVGAIDHICAKHENGK